MDQRDRVWATANRQDGVIAGWQCQRLGMPPSEIRSHCRRGRWQRLYRGVYLVDDATTGQVSPRALTRAALLTAGPHAVAVRETAAAVHGIGGLPRSDGRVHVSLPGRHARGRRVIDSGLVLHQLTIRPEEVTTVDGVVVTTPLRTIADLILALDRYAAVSVMDSALNRGLVGEAEFADLPRLIRGRRGAAKARLWIPEADPRAASPLETRVRLRCVDGKVAPDVLQHPVYDPLGGLIGVADLAWLAGRVLGEADGVEVHGQPAALFKDRWRQNELASAGWSIIRFTWEDTVRPGYIPYVVRSALARAVHG